VRVRRGRMGVASSRGGQRWSAVESGRLAEERVEGGCRGVRSGIRLVDRSESRRFLLTRGRGGRGIRVRESRAKSRKKEVNADLGIPSVSLVRVQGLTHAEVAGPLDVSVKTVQRRLNAAVLALALAEALADLRPDAASTGESAGD
jgi:hypothetical protein